jgi:hypothetical protein
VGATTGLGWMGTLGKSLWIIVDDELYTLEPLTLSAATLIGTLDAVPTEPVVSAEGDSGISYISSYGEGFYELNLNVGIDTLTKFPGVPGTRALTLHRERLFIGGEPSAFSRVYFSDPFAFDSFPALSYFDVPSIPEVRGLYPQRDHLLIGKMDYSWWAFTGTAGATSAALHRLRSGGGAPWHFWPGKAVLNEDDVLWLVAGSHDEPAAYDGTSIERVKHLEGWLAGGINPNSQIGLRVAQLGREDEVLIVSDDPAYDQHALIRRNGVWTRHIYDVDLQGHVASDRQGLVHIADGGAVDAAPKLYTWNGELDRPGRVDDVLARPGDDSDTPLDAWLELPEWWTQGENECRVRGVIVDFVKFDTGAAETNHFEVQVRVHRAYGTVDAEGAAVVPGGEDEVAFEVWDEPTATASVDGTPDVRHFGFGPKKGRGFSLRVEAIRGVAIRSVTAVVQVWERRIG